MYALCLDYKADQVHVPFIMRRRMWQAPAPKINFEGQSRPQPRHPRARSARQPQRALSPPSFCADGIPLSTYLRVFDNWQPFRALGGGDYNEWRLVLMAPFGWPVRIFARSSSRR